MTHGNVLVAAASRNGSTAEIAETIGQALTGRGLRADVRPPGEVESVDDYHAVVLGSAIYGGGWLDEALGFAERFDADLLERPTWLFTSGPVGDPRRNLVQRMSEPPAEVERLRAHLGARGHHVFAGALDKKNLPVLQRFAVTLMRGLEGDFRDWDEIEEWSEGVADELLACWAAVHGE